MKRTYTGTTFYNNHGRKLQEATVRLYITKSNKYDCKGEFTGEPEKIEFTGLKSWTIVEGGPEADAVETIMDEVDENREYLILQFENGRAEFYRNSHVTMFIV
jgi:hypothetical protein